MNQLSGLLVALIMFVVSNASALEVAKELPSTINLEACNGSKQPFKIAIKGPPFFALADWVGQEGEFAISINEWMCGRPNEFKGYLSEKLSFSTVDEKQKRKLIVIDPSLSTHRVSISVSCPTQFNAGPNEIPSMIIEGLNTQNLLISEQ